MSEYTPTPQFQAALERIKKLKLQGVEFFDLMAGISETMKEYSKRLLSAIANYGEDRDIRYYRQELKGLRWLHNRVLELKSEYYNKKQSSRTIRVMPVRRLKKVLANAEKRVDSKPRHKRSYKYNAAPISPMNPEH